MNLASIDTAWLVVALVLLNLFLLVLFPAIALYLPSQMN